MGHSLNEIPREVRVAPDDPDTFSISCFNNAINRARPRSYSPTASIDFTEIAENLLKLLQLVKRYRLTFYLAVLYTTRLIKRNKGGQRPRKERKQRRMAISNNETSTNTILLVNIPVAPYSQFYWQSSYRKSQVLL